MKHWHWGTLFAVLIVGFFAWRWYQARYQSSAATGNVAARSVKSADAGSPYWSVTS